ncbi:MAG: penicillin-binding protein 2 [bacterium]|nr:penicillin-binding protein 2 [bacterium]
MGKKFSDKDFPIGRIATLVLLCFALQIFIIVKLINLQIVRYTGIETRVKEQSEKRIKTIPTRGKIYDREYRVFALTIGKKRIYPLHELCGNTIGFIGKDGMGLEGVEYEFEHVLSGTPGWLTLAKTPYGKLYPYPGLPMKPMKSANDIVLTIDTDIEAIVETALMNRLRELNAKEGSGVVIECKTGEILAMATVPSCNPTEWRRFKEWNNSVIQDQFEPGSSFKVVPISLLMKGKLVGLQDIVEDGSAQITIGNHTIHDVHKHDEFTFSQAVWQSSNVAFVRLTPRIGKDNFYVGSRLFGFGTPTGIPLPGEAPGRLTTPDRWSTLGFANISFGQGMSCNLLQLALAYQAVANKGELLRPIIVKKIISSEGETIYESSPIVVRRVLSPADAQIVNSLLCGVIEYGSGMSARVPGLKMAGKTGTAQKAVNGRYKDAYIASFITFFPADNPEILVACVINEPQGMCLSSQVCGPVIKEIVTNIVKLKQYQCFFDSSLVLGNQNMAMKKDAPGNNQVPFFKKKNTLKLTEAGR